MNKFRSLCLVIALCGMISGLILPSNHFRPVRAEETGVSAAQANKDVPSAKQVGDQLAKQSLEFEENRGQLDERVRYQVRGTGYSLYLTADEAVYVLPMPDTDGAKGRKEEGERGISESAIRNSRSEIRNQKMFALRMKIVGANSGSLYRGEEVREHRTNYFKGNDPENWQTDVPNFSRVRMQEVYPSVSMVWHGKDQDATQYDFVVEPNGNADQIALEFDGAESVEIDAEGDLLIHTEAGTIKQKKPFTYQETGGIKQEVESRFVMAEPTAAAGGISRNQQVRFSLGDYDRSKPLTIDPYSTFLGGDVPETGNSIAVDATGNVYVTGQTQSTNYPTTAGAFDTAFNGSEDVFVTKLNPTGTALIYSTYIGGSGGNIGYAIAIDSSGNAFLTGRTFQAATNYPTTVGAFDTTHNGGDDVFVTKLNAAGSALLYSTFIGGSSEDVGTGIAVDSVGNAFLTGYSFQAATNYPTTAGAFDTTANGNADVFVTKLNAAGSGLIYSTFVGGGSGDIGYGIAFDSSGNGFLTGRTFSSAYPTTVGAFDTTHNGNFDVFVTKLNPTGTALIYSTFIGGSGDDLGYGIDVDSSGNAFLAGYTFSTAYPTTAGAFDTTHNGDSDVFVTKLNPTGTALIYSTFIGGSVTDVGTGIAVDSLGNAFLTGRTNSAAYPTTVGAFDTTHNGSDDVFMTKLNATGSALIYSTFIGGSIGVNSNLDDRGYGIAVDSSGNVFLTGSTQSSNLPTTAGAFDTTYNGGGDVFVTSLSTSSTAADGSISGRVLTPNGQGLRNATVSLTDGNGNTRSTLTSSFGYYRFDEIETGQTVVISVRSKRFQFTPQVVQVGGNIADLDLVPEP